MLEEHVMAISKTVKFHHLIDDTFALERMRIDSFARKTFGIYSIYPPPLPLRPLSRWLATWFRCNPKAELPGLEQADYRSDQITYAEFFPPNRTEGQFISIVSNRPTRSPWRITTNRTAPLSTVFESSVLGDCSNRAVGEFLKLFTRGNHTESAIL